MPEESPVINHNTGEHSKSINNTDQYFEAGKEMLLPILERIDKLLIMVLEEKKQLVSERKLLLDIFDKLANKLNDR